MIQSANFGSTLTGVDEKTGATFSRSQGDGSDYNTMFQTMGAQQQDVISNAALVANWMQVYNNDLVSIKAGRTPPALPPKPLVVQRGDGYIDAASGSVMPGMAVSVAVMPALPDLPEPTPPANPGGSPIPNSPTPDPIVNLQNSVNVLQNEMKALLAHFGITG